MGAAKRLTWHKMKDEEKSETLFASGTENRKIDQRVRELEGKTPIDGSLVCARPWHGPIQRRAARIEGASFA